MKSPSLSVILQLIVLASGLAHAEARDYVQILYDTTEPAIPGMQPHFGYSVYIHADGKRILLDTGTIPEIMENNLRAAGVDVAALDLVVLSHNHHDHAGGLERIRAMNGRVPVYVPPNQRFPIGDVQVIEDHLRVTPNIFVIRGHTDVPTAGISDDLSVVVRGRLGPYVLATCSHSGVRQIIERATAVTGEPVYYYSGGSRLVHRPEGDTQIVADTFKQSGVQVVSPSHCSLSHRIDGIFRQTLGERVQASQLGRKIEVRLPQ